MLASQSDLETQTKIAQSNLTLAEANATALEEALRRKDKQQSKGGQQGTPELQQNGFFAPLLDQRSPYSEPAFSSPQQQQQSTPAESSSSKVSFWKRKKSPAPTPAPAPQAPLVDTIPLQPPPDLGSLSGEGSSSSTSRFSSGSSTTLGSSGSNSTNAASSVDSLRAQLQSLAVTHSSAVSRLQLTSETLEKLRADHAHLQRTHGQTLNEHQELQVTHDSLKSELESLSVELFEEANQMVAAEHKSRAEEVDRLQAQIEQLTQQVHDLEAKQAARSSSVQQHASKPSHDDQAQTHSATHLSVPSTSDQQEAPPDLPDREQSKSPTTLDTARSWLSSALGRQKSTEGLRDASRDQATVEGAAGSPEERVSGEAPRENREDGHEVEPGSFEQGEEEEDLTFPNHHPGPDGDAQDDASVHSKKTLFDRVSGQSMNSQASADERHFTYMSGTAGDTSLNRSHFSNDTPSATPSPEVSMHSLRRNTSNASSTAAVYHHRRSEAPAMPTTSSRKSLSSLERWQESLLAGAKGEDVALDQDDEDQTSKVSPLRAHPLPKDESFDSLPSIDSDRTVETIEWSDEDEAFAATANVQHQDVHELDKPTEGAQSLKSSAASVSRSNSVKSSRSLKSSASLKSSTSSRRKSLENMLKRNESLKRNELFDKVKRNPDSRLSTRLEGLRIFNDPSGEQSGQRSPLASSTNSSFSNKSARSPLHQSAHATFANDQDQAPEGTDAEQTDEDTQHHFSAGRSHESTNENEPSVAPDEETPAEPGDADEAIAKVLSTRSSTSTLQGSKDSHASLNSFADLTTNLPFYPRSSQNSLTSSARSVHMPQPQSSSPSLTHSVGMSSLQLGEAVEPAQFPRASSAEPSRPDSRASQRSHSSLKQALRSSPSMSSVQVRSGHNHRSSFASSAMSSAPSVEDIAALDSTPAPEPTLSASASPDHTPTLTSAPTFSSSGHSIPNYDDTVVEESSPPASTPARPRNFMDRWESSAGKKVADPHNQVWSRAGRLQQQHKLADVQRSSQRQSRLQSLQSQTSGMKRDNSSLDSLMRSSKS